MEASNLVLGIFTAGFLVFLGNANISAHKQKISSVRLKAYLMYWKGKAIELDAFSIFYQGVRWNEEIIEIIKKGGGTENILKVEEKIKETTYELKKAIESGELDFNTIGLKEQISEIPEVILNDFTYQCTLAEQNIIEGKTFITDEQASILTSHTAYTCVTLKMELVTVISSLCLLVIKISLEDSDFDMNKYAAEIAELVWKAIVISKHIDTLYTAADSYINRSIFTLTLENMGVKV